MDESLEGRRLLVSRVLEQGRTPAVAAEAQGCSKATAHKWLRRFEAEGERGLHDCSSRPHRSPSGGCDGWSSVSRTLGATASPTGPSSARF
jgi:leucine-zipper of insertion element IS481